MLDKLGAWSAAPSCDATGTSTLPSCSRFYYTGVKQAVNCGGTKKCFVEMQLDIGGTSHWMFSHNCGQQSSHVSVQTNNRQCGGGAFGFSLGACSLTMLPAAGLRCLVLHCEAAIPSEVVAPLRLVCPCFPTPCAEEILDCAACGSGPAGSMRVASTVQAAEYFADTEACGCGRTPLGALPSCTAFYFTGERKAIDCQDDTIHTRTCYAKVQLGTAAGGPTFWLKSHECGQGPGIVSPNDALCAAGGAAGWNCVHTKCCAAPEGCTCCVPKACVPCLSAKPFPGSPRRSPIMLKLSVQRILCTLWHRWLPVNLCAQLSAMPGDQGPSFLPCRFPK